MAQKELKTAEGGMEWVNVIPVWLAADPFRSIAEWRARQIAETGKPPREITLTRKQYADLRTVAEERLTFASDVSEPEVMGMKIRIKAANVRISDGAQTK